MNIVRIAMIAAAGVMLCAAPAFAQTGPTNDDQILLASTETTAPADTVPTIAAAASAGTAALNPETGCLIPHPKMPYQFIDSRVFQCYLGQRKQPRTAEELQAALNSDEVCSLAAQRELRPNQRCGILVYELLPEYEPSDRVPRIALTPIWRVRNPDNLRNMIIETGDEDGKILARPFDLLDDLVSDWTMVSCRKYKNNDRRKGCEKTGKDGEYRFLGVLGFRENETALVMTGESAEYFFKQKAYIPPNGTHGS